MPVSHVHANGLQAVGVCVPRSPVVSPTTTLLQVVLWQVKSDGTVREIQRPVLIDPALFDVGEAYYAPPADEGDFWPPGRYVFEIKRAAGGTGSASRWIGLEFIPTA